MSVLLRDCLAFFDRFFDRAHHVKSLFGQVVVFTVNDLAEAPNRVLELDVLSLKSGELSGDKKWLRKEALHSARAGNN